MKKILFLAIVASVITTSCKKGFTKNEEARFKVNGVEYTIDGDGIATDYFSSGSNKLQITCTGGSGGTFQTGIVVNLLDLNQVVAIDSAEDGFSYFHSGAIMYKPKRGTWEITSHKEGNPATRHTEGKFDMVVFDPMNPTDTFNITDGYFYVNNY